MCLIKSVQHMRMKTAYKSIFGKFGEMNVEQAYLKMKMMF